MRRKKDFFNNYGFSFRLAVFVVAAIAFGFILGLLYKSFLGGAGAFCLNDDSYKRGVEDSRVKLEKSGLLKKVDAKRLSGEVVSIKESEITFTATLPNPLLSDNLKTKTAVVTDKTVVVLRKEKGLEEREKDNQAGSALLAPLKKQVEDLKKAASSCGLDDSGKGKCLEIEAQLVELKAQIIKINNEMMAPTVAYIGQMADLKGSISVVVEADEDIAEKQKFEVVKVELTQMAEKTLATPALP